MKKRLITCISIVLAFLMVFNIALPAFANNENRGNMALEKINDLPADQKVLLQNAIYNPEFNNFTELSNSNQELVNEITKKPNLYLVEAGVINDQIVLIYDTLDSNVKIGITDGYAEVVRIKDENTFFINDEKHHIEVVKIVEYERSREGIVTSMAEKDSEKEVSHRSNMWRKISNPGGGWVFTGSTWYDVRLQTTINNFTVAVLGLILGHYCGALGGVLSACAGMLISSAYAAYSSVAKIHKWRFDHATYPQIYKWHSNVCYAVFQGEDIFIGTEDLYYERIL